MDLDKTMDNLANELNAQLRAMAKAETVEEKVAYSEVVKNLTESIGIFLGLASDMMAFDVDEV
jgi:hypothetical protein